MTYHSDIARLFLSLSKAVIISAGMIFVSPCPAGFAAGEDPTRALTLQASQQDGYANDHAYNIADPVLLCGREGFAAVLEFPLQPGLKLNSARLHLPVAKVKKPGRVALYHLLNFNNGYAETQDFYANAKKVGEQDVQVPGEITFDVTAAVKTDAKGPGGFTSYRLCPVEPSTEIVLSSFDSGKEKARITIE